MTAAMNGRQRDGRVPPHDLDAEEALLGAMLLSAEARRVASGIVGPEDFYRPANGSIYDALIEAHVDGAVDVRVVADILSRHGALEQIGGPATLISIAAATPATSNVERYCRIVVEMSALRQVIGLCGEFAEQAYAVPSSIEDLLDAFQGASRTVELPTVRAPDVISLDLFLESAPSRPDWIIPPFLERGDRMIVIAAEGYGKGVLLRQMVVASAQGVNPFTLNDRMPPARSLLIDLENPATIIRKTMGRMVAQARAQVGQDYDPGRMMIWHEPAGIDIRGRADFARLDTALSLARPDLVAVGPLYKLFRKAKGESDEDAALDVTARLDDLRTRHGFTLIIEHHAPKGPASSREMTPFGSAVWLRWPEFGPALYPHPKAAPGDRSRLQWGHWRGPRDERPWPTEMEWGQTWPWSFIFDHAVVGYSGGHQQEAF